MDYWNPVQGLRSMIQDWLYHLVSVSSVRNKNRRERSKDWLSQTTERKIVSKKGRDIALTLPEYLSLFLPEA